MTNASAAGDAAADPLALGDTAGGARKLVGDLSFECGYEHFAENDIGIHLPEAVVEALARVVEVVRANPSWSLLLEGHCLGIPDDLGDFRGSIGEEAADLCKERLVQAGVENEIVCKGLGSANGSGMRVLMSLFEPPPAPKEEPRSSDAMWSLLVKDVAGKVEGEAPEEPRAEEFDFQIPSLNGLSDAEQLAILEEQLMQAVPDGFHFETNQHSISEIDLPMVRRIAQLLKLFPRLGVQCAGHTKGQPSRNNFAKRALSQDRANALRDALKAAGAPNAVACVGFGCALARGNCVRLHGMLPGEAEEEDAVLKILGWNTAGLSIETEQAAVNQLLKEALDQGLEFQPNKASIAQSAEGVVRRLGWVLKAFPNWNILCEGHCKGRPDEQSENKVKLSQARAERVVVALQALGVQNRMESVGCGCQEGLGMCVRMFAKEPARDIEIPDVEGLSKEERFKILDGLLSKILEHSMHFEQNCHDVSPSNLGTIRAIARVLKAFPDATVRIEGHTKGKADENSELKKKLSQARAEAVRVAVRLEGAHNEMLCIGLGSELGGGANLRIYVVDPKELESDQLAVPDVSSLSHEEQGEVLNKLLAEAEGPLEFEPNSDVVPISDMHVVRRVAAILKAFPSFAITCEGHSKGTKESNTTPKVKLSHLRAEAFKRAVLEEGATNFIRVVGRGSEDGLGMRVRMFVFDPDAPQEHQVEIPEQAGMGREERRCLLNGLLEKILERKITFDPNSVAIEMSAVDVVAEIARVLKSFPEFTVVCEGHTKGTPDSNTVAKTRLSKARAGSVRTALVEHGVESAVVCSGMGSSEGRGMCVRIFAPSPEEEVAALAA